MNTSVDPCDDFYEYACGSYDVVNKIPEHASRISTFAEIARDLDIHLKAILQNSSRDNSSASMIFVQTYFDSCMDQESVDNLGLEPLFDLISSLGGWSVLDNSTGNSNTTWEELAGNLALHNVFPIFKPLITTSYENTKKNMLNFGRAETTLSGSKQYEGEILEHYKQYMSTLLELLGANVSGEKFDDVSELLGANETSNLIDDIIDFEKSLAEIINFSPEYGDQNLNKNIMTYGEFKKRYNFINWDLYFNEDLKNPLGIMPDSLEINIYKKGYYDKLNSVLNSTSPKTIQNYLMWHLIRNYNKYLPAKYREPLTIFNKNLEGSNEQIPLWQLCLSEVRDKLSIPMANEFLHKYFTENDKFVAENMVKDLKDIMKIELEKVDWLDETTRKTALEKLEKMNPRIGYPDYLLNETAVLLPFNTSTLQPTQFLKNAISLIKAKEIDTFSKLYSTPEVDWAYLLDADAFNYINMNTIMFPAGILQYPMFVAQAPAAVNYASMGMVIGHEITHGYDTVGSQVDENGALRNWWDNETSIEFENKTQCFIDQYDKQIEPLTGRKLAGKHTLAENIADNGGLRIAYQAYLRKLDEKSKKLAGMEEFSHQKTFFIAFANNFCEHVKPASMNNTLDTDSHSPGYFRANLPLQNLPQFSEVFQCAKGSGMNPEKKCRIW